MTSKLTGESSQKIKNESKLSKLGQNQFARIQGLEPAMLLWLREAFQVFTVEDLAQLSVNQIFFRLQDEEVAISRRQVETWIFQAKELTKVHSPWKTFSTFVVSLQSRQIGNHIDQRTVAYYLEADKRQVWPGIECKGVCNMILDQLEQSLQSGVSVTRGPELSISEAFIRATSEGEADSENEPAATDTDAADSDVNVDSDTAAVTTTHAADESADEEANLESSPSEQEGEAELEEEPVRLEIIQLKLHQQIDNQESGVEGAKAESTETEKVTVIDVSKRMIMDSLPKGEPFDLEVTFQIFGSRAVELTKQALPYHVEAYCQNRISLRKLSLGAAVVGQLMDEQLIYTCRLSQLSVPEAGPYRLQILTRLENSSVKPDFLELPFVQVA